MPAVNHYHIITQHFVTLDWLKIQTSYLNKYAPPSSRLTIWIVGVELPADYMQEVMVGAMHINLSIKNIPNDHYLVMEGVYNMLLDKFNDDDVVIFLDSDAFPIKPLVPELDKMFRKSEVVTVYRYEDYNDDDGMFP